MSEQSVEQNTTLEEKEYKYQPTDAEGRPIGGIQVIKYTTADELAEKLREQNILLIRKLREQTKKIRLGVVETEEIDESAPTFDGFTEFTPRDLTDEERYDLARKLQDPTTAFEAVNTIVEAQVGAPLNEIGSEVTHLRQENLNLKAKLEAEAFSRDNPDYYKCQENLENITAWMVRYNLQPVKANFQKAYDTLKQQGVMILGAAPTQEVVPAVEPVTEQIQQQEPVVIKRVSSGLNNDDSSSIGTPIAPGSDIVYEFVVDKQTHRLTGAQAIAAMPSDEYKKRLLHDKDFAGKVEKLMASGNRK